MANPLRAAYEAAKNGTAPVTAPTGAPAVAAPPAATAVVQTTQIPASAGGKRDIAALRAKLASGALGGVNPPEAPAAITEDHAEPRTVETAEGGATPAPGWVEAKPGLVVRAPAVAEPEPASSPSTDGAPAAELSRGQKAAATRAANKAKAEQVALASQQVDSTAVLAAAAVSSVAASGNELARIADALEEIAKTLRERLPS